MKIAGLRLKNYKQFEDIYLDFTGPDGKPLNKVCFIGRNGTGKSTILNLLMEMLDNLRPPNFDRNSYFFLKIFIENKFYFILSSIHIQELVVFTEGIEKEQGWFDRLVSLKNINQAVKMFDNYRMPIQTRNEIFDRFDLHKKQDLIIYSPAESNENNNMQIKDVPETNLNNALVLFNEFPKKHTISDQNAGEFWKILIYQIKKRENEREKFENKPQNLNKTKKQLIQEFDQQNPKILEKIADLWNKILDPAGLEFDLENASNPIQLNDNLKAYIRLKSTKERINYNQLSTGIRNFMFRLGHIYSLYFNREVKNGFLLIDEPENSLFPDFLIELVDTYLDIIKDKNDESNTQFFASTHSPIIAAQFEPYERIVLEWNEKGAVDAYKGEAPAGDDPNDILSKDFKMRNLMGKKGQQMWKEYVALRNKLIHTSDEKKKTELISKINKIGELYNFEV